PLPAARPGELRAEEHRTIGSHRCDRRERRHRRRERPDRDGDRARPAHRARDPDAGHVDTGRIEPRHHGWGRDTAALHGAKLARGPRPAGARDDTGAVSAATVTPTAAPRVRGEDQTVAKEDKVEFEGEVIEALPNAMFRVKLDNDHVVLGHVAGKMRRFRIRILPGDRVRCELSPYDLDRARIVYRHR